LKTKGVLHSREKTNIKKTVNDRHKLGRVLSFFSSRRIWDSPTHSPAGDCVPPLVGSGGVAALACSRGGEGVPIPTRDIHCGTLHIHERCDDDRYYTGIRKQMTSDDRTGRSSVADPDPDPRVFGPPGSGSGSIRGMNPDPEPSITEEN
jgi:hypothetical protein